MKYLKRNLSEIPLEEAHGGTGARQMLLHPDYLTSSYWEAVTKGFLKSGNAFDWHSHKDTDEIFIVTKGEGKFSYRENGEEKSYSYQADDVIITPANIEHKIEALGDVTTEGFFFRIKATEGVEHDHHVVLLHMQDVPLEQVHSVPESRKTLVTADVVATDYLEAITKGFLPAGREWEWHDHDKTDELCIVLKGTGEYSVADEMFEWKAGDVVIVPANILHKQKATQDTEFFFIRVKA